MKPSITRKQWAGKHQGQTRAGGWRFLNKKGGFYRVSNWMENLKITECAKSNQYKRKRRANRNSSKTKCCFKTYTVVGSYLDLQ